VEDAQRPIYALVLRLAAMMMIATMFAGVKYAGQIGISLPDVMFWRQIIPVCLILGWLFARGEVSLLRTQRLARHGLRAVVGMAGMVCGFTAATLLPLAEAVTLGYTTPFFAVILTAIFLRERVGPWRWSAVAIGFLGVLVIAQPGVEALHPVGTAAGIIAGFLVAVISFQIRDLARSDGTISVVFYFSLFGAGLVLPFLPFYASAHAPFEWLLLLGIGVSGTLGQLLVSASLRHGAVASVIVMDYTSLVWATLFGYLIWDHMPPYTTWLGAPAIVAAGVLIAWREQKLSRPITPPAALEME
jgi:drug/metabolite transporter (DMT)-like permease